jgi:hypothetical protein
LPKYFIDATVYATYEYSNGAEIEADTAEEAGRKFKELVAQRRNTVLDLRNPTDHPRIEGHFRVIAMWDGMSDDDLMDVEAEIEGEAFVGPY